MSDQTLTKLAVIALIMAVVAFGVNFYVNKPVDSGRMEETPLIQGLDTTQIASIELGDPSSDTNEPIKLVSQGKNTFVLASKYNYPCKIEKINNLLADCLDLKVNQLVTSNPANHEKLGVAEIDPANKPDENSDKKLPRNVVKFFDKDGNLITGVIVGERTSQGGSYVRRLSKDEADSKKVYLAETTPWLQMSALSYVEKKLFLVEKKDIEKVEVERPDGNYTIVADGDKTVLQSIPEGKRAKGTDYERVFTAVNSLEMNDLMPASEAPADLKFDSKYICTLKDKTIATFELGVKDDKLYVKCSSKYTGEKVTINPNKQDSEEELKEKEARLNTMQASDDFAKKHRDWVYEVVSWQKDNLTKKFADLVEDIPAPEKAEGSEAGAPAGEVKVETPALVPPTPVEPQPAGPAGPEEAKPEN